MIMSLDTEILATLATGGRLSAIIEHVGSLPHTQRADAIETIQRGLSKPLSTRLNYIWPLRARESQLPPTGDWDTWLILAGRGFGKTRAGAEWVRAQVETRQADRIALVARSLPEALSIMVHGESGIINVSPPWNKPTYEPSKRKLTWPTGAHALVFSSHEPDQLRGPQFDAAWCDELASWEYPEQTWDNLSFALRLGRHPRSVVTTTPKPIKLIRDLPNSPGTYVTRGTTFDNKDNLAPAFFNGIIDRYDGTRIGQQEIYAEITDEDEDALWKREWIEKARLGSHPPIARIVVSIDPAMSTQAHKLRDRHSRRRGRHATPARLHPGRRVRQAHPQQHGSQSRPPLRQVQRHPDSRRGKRRRKPCRDHAEERDRAHPAHQVHPRQTWQANQSLPRTPIRGQSRSPPCMSREESTT